MTRGALASAVLAALALAACVPAPVRTTAVAPLPPLLPVPAGLEVAAVPQGAGREISFGRTQASTVAAVSRVLRRSPDVATLHTACPDGPLAESRWSRDGLSLYFAGGDFAGWRSGGGRTYPGPLRQAGRACP